LRAKPVLSVVLFASDGTMDILARIWPITFSGYSSSRFSWTMEQT
jgi:hypothetical protein